MSRSFLEGIFVPNVTPFTRKGRLDIEALRACVRFWVESGVSGLVPCGSNGEAPYLSRQERKKVIETVVDEVNGKIPVVAGTGSMSTRETILLSKDAEDLGVDAVLVVTPFYYKLADREILEHYRINIPMVVYNAPKFTGVSLEPAVIHQLASENERLIGVKDSGGNIVVITEIMRLVGTRISVLAGAADLALPTLKLGGKGAVIAVANVFPALCRKLYEAFRSDKLENADRLQERVTRVNDVLVKRHNQLSAIKEALRMRGIPAGYPRKPALTLGCKEKMVVLELLNTVSASV
jgi:4-hydroxy-tetrahydrodipicolinate synthase